MDTAVSSAASTAAAMASAVTASPTTVTSSDKGTTSAGSSVTVMTTSSLPSIPKFSTHTGDSSSLTLSETSVAALPPGSVRPHFAPVSGYPGGGSMSFPSSTSFGHPSMPHHTPGMGGFPRAPFSPGMGDLPRMPYPSGVGGFSSTGVHSDAMMGMRSGAESPTETGSLSGAELPPGTDSLSRDEKFARFEQQSSLGLTKDIFNKSSSFMSKMETQATVHSKATSLTPSLDYSSFETSESFTAEEAPAQPFNDVRLDRKVEAGFKRDRKDVTVNHEKRLNELKTHYDEAMTENEAKTKGAHEKVHRDIETRKETVNALKEKVTTLLQQLDPFLAPKGSQDADYLPPQLNESQLKDLNAKLRDARLELYDAQVELARERFNKDKINLESELQQSLLSDDRTIAVKTFEGDEQRGMDNIDNKRALAQQAILGEQKAERSSEPSVSEKTTTETPTPTKASLESVEPPATPEEFVSEVDESGAKTDTSATRSSWGGFGDIISSLTTPFRATTQDADYTELEAPLSEEVRPTEDGDNAVALEQSTDRAGLEELRAQLAQVKSNQQAIRDSGIALDARRAETKALMSEFELKDVGKAPDGESEMTKF